MVKKVAFFYIILFFSSSLFSQSSKADSLKFNASIDYLERKLNYTYFSDDQKLWWINKFKYNTETGEIKIQHISTKNPGKVLGKSYNTTTVSLSDLNPYNITINKNNEGKGRFVKGNEISLHTVKNKKHIRKEVNGTRLSPRSFIYISIPGFVDEETNVSDSVFMTLQYLIGKASELSRQTDDIANFELIFQTLQGDHQYTNAEGQVQRFGKKLNDYLIAFEDYQNREKLRDVFIGYDTQANRYYEIIVGSDGTQTIKYFMLNESEELILSTPENDVKIWFANRSKIHYESGGETYELTHLAR